MQKELKACLPAIRGAFEVIPYGKGAITLTLIPKAHQGVRIDYDGRKKVAEPWSLWVPASDGSECRTLRVSRPTLVEILLDFAELAGAGLIPGSKSLAWDGGDVL